MRDTSKPDDALRSRRARVADRNETLGLREYQRVTDFNRFELQEYGEESEERGIIWRWHMRRRRQSV